MGSLGARVSRTRTIPGVYSLMVPVISAPVLGSGLPLVGWASAMATKRMVATKARSGLIMGFRQRFACPENGERAAKSWSSERRSAVSLPSEDFYKIVQNLV